MKEKNRVGDFKMLGYIFEDGGRGYKPRNVRNF